MAGTNEATETSRNIQEGAEELADLRRRMGADATTLLDHAFHALRRGRRIAPAELAEKMGWDARRLEAALAEGRRRGLGTFDEGAHITGSWGLSVEPTRHHLRLDGKPLYAWCAMDAVGIPAALEADATIESTLDADDAPLTIQIRGGRLTEVSVPDVVIAIPTARLEKDLRKTLCPRINFHRRDQAPQHAEIAVLSLEEAVRAGRDWWAATASAAVSQEEDA